MKGFFGTSELAANRKALPLIPQCGACGLHKRCGPGGHPKMPIDGEGHKGILVYGESPGKSENERGIPFIGEAGDLLWDTLAEFEVKRNDCWIGNALRCFPGSGKAKAIPPKAVEHCRPFLVQAVEELKPHVIIPLGALAIKSVIGWLWREDVGQAGRWDGWRIPSQKLNAWICPTWHPSYILRSENDREKSLRKLFFQKHLQAACKLTERPWKEVPDWGAKVRVELDVDRAAAEVRKITQFGSVAAFDYETNMLKPDSEQAAIISCAVSNGRRTVAYPWHGEAIRATREFLRSGVPKVGSNVKFEERWTMREFGHGIRGWCWDTMTAAHMLDNRGGVTGIEFQAFALLGQEPWDSGVSEFFTSKGPNLPNRIREVPLERLLRYNGTDALLELMVARKQAGLIGVNL